MRYVINFLLLLIIFITLVFHLNISFSSWQFWAVFGSASCIVIANELYIKLIY